MYKRQLFNLNKRQAQYQALQNQINPHFLYNTLDAIVWEAEAGHSGEVIHITRALSDFFRISLSSGADWIPLAQELKHLSGYLSIQKARYRDILNYRIDVPQELGEVYVLKLLLQPLVENAIHHAAEKMLDVCVIRVSGAATADGVDIIVQDNGPGTDEDILNKLESGEVQPEGLGIGMRNIHKRVQHAFSEQYGLRVCSEEGQTQITVHLPDTRPEPHNKA